MTAANRSATAGRMVDLWLGVGVARRTDSHCTQLYLLLAHFADVMAQQPVGQRHMRGHNGSGAGKSLYKDLAAGGNRVSSGSKT